MAELDSVENDHGGVSFSRPSGTGHPGVMKLIDRYIGREIIVTALFAIGILSVVLVFGNIFKQLLDLLVNHDVPLEYILSFVGYILPFSLTFTIPWGFLTAVLLVFGKMSAENEILALRTSGLSMARLSLSLLVLVIVACGLCLWINLDVAPRAQEKMKSALFTIVTSNPIALFGSDHIISEFPGRKIYVEKTEGTNLRNILLYEMNDRDEPIRVVHAKRGELATDWANKQVLLKIFDARFEQRDDASPGDLTKIRQGITMSEGVLPIPLKELYEKNQRRRGLSQMTASELMNNKNDRQITAKRTELNKRYSFSLASFAFALLGVPLAITAHRKETSIGFFFSLIIAFVYFFFIIIADTVRNNEKWHPELLMWAPNVIFIALGAWLFWRLSKK
jgi:LPS export ABC transporter permease LptF